MTENKAAAIAFLELASRGKVSDAYAKYVGAGFKHHNPFFEGSAEALKAELAESRPDLLRYLSNQVPSMYSKAYRWVAELDEIAAFVGEEFPERDMLQAAARLYQRIAEDFEDRKEEIGKLDRFLEKS